MNNKKFRFVPFSTKQKFILTWWASPKYKEKDAIIADGAVRSGKTLIMSLSFVIWAMESFEGKSFGMSGKTIGSFKRNVWMLLKVMLRLRGYRIAKLADSGDNVFTISRGGKSNNFFLFGGRDERSQDLVQGFTAAGFLFDEVVLMPKSFVNQAIARCSEEGSKLWFNCNPDSPFHWFKVEWIEQLAAKHAIHVKFELDDNPSLSEAKKEQYKRQFAGLFYQRFILGLWVLAEGIIYSMFNSTMVTKQVPLHVKIVRKWIAIDYGQSNATVFLLNGLGSDNKLYILDEYYHSGGAGLVQKSPATYSKDFVKWLHKNGTKEDTEEGIKEYMVRTETIFIDPSAKGFMLQLYEEGIKQIRQADNEVIRGIGLISSMIDKDLIRVLSHCVNTINEFGSYRWDPKAQQRGEDLPVKDDDHCMDALRYCVNGNRLLFQRLVVKEL